MCKLLEKIDNLKGNYVINVSNLDKYNLNRTDINRLCNQKKIERVARGIYINSNEAENIPFEFSDLFYTVLSIKHGVIFGLSALSYYGLTDEIPRKF
ncbi:MAG: type IV toxin-antitoxin system AbiEi family antitoxin domain-containing protein, partial [Candidatus Sericytochromatia bacterium]|nr:type IV toxin-antitoxin system AbiEi family antitoxin domain-containing protein [Candidatus Sericytochromatia bacterium]